MVDENQLDYVIIQGGGGRKGGDVTCHRVPWLLNSAAKPFRENRDDWQVFRDRLEPLTRIRRIYEK